MKIKIYDYNNKSLEIKTKKDIVAIGVLILSGDEIIDIIYEDKNYESFDSCQNNSRFFSCYDGHYIVTSDKIKEWNDFKFTKGTTFSYERLEKFKGGI